MIDEDYEPTESLLDGDFSLKLRRKSYENSNIHISIDIYRHSSWEDRNQIQSIQH